MDKHHTSRLSLGSAFSDADRTKKALALFRRIIVVLKNEGKRIPDMFLAHSELARVSEEQFDIIFQPLLSDPEAVSVLQPLMVYEALPDRKHWARHLPEFTWDQAAKVLAKTVMTCYDHQSQESTDCRWLRVMALIAQDRLRIGQPHEQQFREIVDYPHVGDMRSVRPSIRALEMSTRTEAGTSSWPESFWQENFKATICIPLKKEIVEREIDFSSLIKTCVSMYDDIIEHFYSTVTTTGVDPRHDAAFGFCLYILGLLLDSAAFDKGRRVPSRLLLRTAVESFITMAFLLRKDDPTLWMQYRNYGNGRNKLAFLKNMDAEELPEFLDIMYLQQLANEDVWMEYQDIHLGSFSTKTLGRWRLRPERRIFMIDIMMFCLTMLMEAGQW